MNPIYKCHKCRIHIVTKAKHIYFGFFHSGSTKTNFNAKFVMLSIDKTEFIKCVRDTKKIKIPHSSQKDGFQIRILVQQRSPTGYNYPCSHIIKVPNRLTL